jgi:preprotein translocase subunit Sec63
MIADDPAALVLLAGILLVVGVVLPRFARRWRRGGANVKRP